MSTVATQTLFGSAVVRGVFRRFLRMEEDVKNESTVGDDGIANTTGSSKYHEQESSTVLISAGNVHNNVENIKKENIPNIELYGAQWAAYLGTQNRPGIARERSPVYTGKNSEKVKEECKVLAHLSMGSFSPDDIELIVYLFCEREECDFDLHWFPILEMLIPLKASIDDTFNMFFVIVTKFLPRNSGREAICYQLMHLLLQYHDPILSSYFESRKISTYEYANPCFASIFAGAIDKKVLYVIWDKYFEKGDPFMLFSMVLVFLINCSEELVKVNDKTKICEMVHSSISSLAVEDVGDFFDLAVHFLSHTPASVKRDFQRSLFGSRCAGDTRADISRLLALPVDARDLIHLAIDDNSNVPDQPFSFFTIDSRPLDEFLAGHLEGSYNLDCRLFAEEPDKYHMALSSLDAFRCASRPEDHILFLGEGNEATDLYMNMVIANFLQQGRLHVAVVQGGYKALHSLMYPNLDRLDGHCTALCKECNTQSPVSDTPRRSSWRLGMGNILGAVKASAPTISEKVRHITQLPGLSNRNTSVSTLVHVETSQRHGKRYRNERSVFTLSDSDSEIEFSSFGSSNTSIQSQKLSDVLVQYNVLEHFDGVEVLLNETEQITVNCYIALTPTHMHVLHQAKKDDEVIIQSRHAYSSVLRVASKKRIPEMITFKFGYCNDDGEYKVTDVHRFILPRAGECAKAVKMNIMNLKADVLQ